MTTLHSYVLRELLKIFVLTLITLTVLLTMGGGVYNLVKFEGVSAGDFAGFMPLFLPIVVTLVMPLAALFAVTMVYGRLAADNELLACSAAGINIHRLLLSAVLLAVFVAAFCLTMSNFVIPSYVRTIEGFARNNYADLVLAQLQSKGYFRVGKAREGTASEVIHTLTAESARRVPNDELREKGYPVAPRVTYLFISGPTYLQTSGSGEVTRFASAKAGLCIIDASKELAEVALDVFDARDYEVGKRAAVIERQRIGPVAIPQRFAGKAAEQDLPTLLRWLYHPWEAPPAADQVLGFRLLVAAQAYFDDCRERIERGEPITLEAPDGRTAQIRGTMVERRELVLQFEPATVSVAKAGEAPVRYEAPRAMLKLRPTPELKFLAEIRLERIGERQVLEYNPRSVRPDEPREKPALSVDVLNLPPFVDRVFADVAPADAVNPAVGLPLGLARLAERLPDDSPDRLGLSEQALLDRLDSGRVKLRRESWEARRKVLSTLNVRLSLASSTLVTLLMGAALGVAYRGGRALAAFGLAFVPAGCLLFLIGIASQFMKKDETAAIGMYVTWGGMAVYLLADLLLIRFGVRR